MTKTMCEPKVLIVMGSDSDYGVMKDCIEILRKFQIDFECTICSAHRTPDRARELAVNAAANGYGCIIAAAGKAAHLPGVLAAFTTLPVIGVPIKGDALSGMDALLSICQMPPGIPVATVAINGAVNAGILAVQMLSGRFTELQDKLASYKKELADKVAQKDAKLQSEL